jgi:hypothetical protein
MVPIAGAAVSVATALNGLRKAVQEAAAEAVEAGRKYEGVSGSMAAVMAKVDAEQLARDVKAGEATAGSTGRVADAESRRRDAFAPLEQAWANLKNDLIATGTEIVTKVTAPLLEELTGLVNSVDGLAKDVAEGVGLMRKTESDVGSLNDVRDRIFEDANRAQLKARAALDRMQDAARGGDRTRTGDF